MTEYIKQWIADESDRASTCEKITGEKFIDGTTRMPYRLGLEKGIEIAEGFLDWAETEQWYREDHDKKWYSPHIGNEGITTSQLLEKYLQTLNT